jgi:hypothetical protein
MVRAVLATVSLALACGALGCAAVPVAAVEPPPPPAPPSAPAAAVAAVDSCVAGDFARCSAQCAQSDGDACNDLGALQELGVGTQRDVAAAAKSYASACNTGVAAGCLNAARLRADGGGGASASASAPAVAATVATPAGPAASPASSRLSRMSDGALKTHVAELVDKLRYFVESYRNDDAKLARGEKAWGRDLPEEQRYIAAMYMRVRVDVRKARTELARRLPGRAEGTDAEAEAPSVPEGIEHVADALQSMSEELGDAK